MNLLWVILLSITFLIVYSNLNKLNEIVIFFIFLGSSLILIILFFWIKYFYKFLKKVYYWLKGERNWVRYLLMFILLILIWNAYQQKDTFFNPVLEIYNETDFSLFFPLKISLDSLDYESGESTVYEKNDEDYGISNFVKDTFSTDPERKDECMEGIDLINKLRLEEGLKSIKWDDRLYNLAIFRAKDMYERKYFDHVTPEGKCVKDFKFEYGLEGYTIAENCGAQSWNLDYKNMNYDTTINVEEQISNWMSSRGHRYNLLYPDHIIGVIGCYYGACVFLGGHTNSYGLGAGPCTTGEEGEAFWETVGKQPGEI